MATEHHHNPIRTLLANTSVSALQSPKGRVVVIDSSESPYEGFKKLSENNILSAPVYNASTKKYTGFLDMRDLVSFVVFIDDDQKSDVPSDLETLVMHGSRLFKQPVEGVTCTYLSRRNVLHPVSETDSLLTVCETLAKGVHRVPVVNAEGEVVNIISQSSIIAFLNKHINDFKAETSKKLADVPIGTKNVISVGKNTKAIEAFRLMDNKKISGLAVVEEETGKLIGNTSGSDLKLFIKTPSLELLQQPVMKFLNQIRQESIDIKTPTITCSPKDTIATLIGKLALTKVHKLFVADDASGFKPLSVISITDVLRYLMAL
mmetsp:Transcript_21652/g.30287  ORF Transcript_21652/g.30287 Transcript_21652/m.30287 type:complete len:319 (-) Transcript_21652:131-1087(-)